MNFKSGTKQMDQFFLGNKLFSGHFLFNCWLVMFANGYAIMAD